MTPPKKPSHKKTASKPKKLPCGHPGARNNLIKGKCGTCDMLKEWEDCAKSFPAALKIVRLIKEGAMWYNSKGSTMLELAKRAEAHRQQI